MRSGPLTRMLFVAAAFCVAAAASAVVETSGVVTGVWTSENGPYIVTEDVIVPVDATLQIEPGVIVDFAEGTRMVVHGELVVRGTAKSPVKFDALEEGGWWEGIRILGTSRLPGMMEYGEIYNSVDGLWIEQTTFDVNDTQIQATHRGVGIFNDAAVKLDGVSVEVHGQNDVTTHVIEATSASLFIDNCTLSLEMLGGEGQASASALRLRQVEGRMENTHVDVASDASGFGVIVRNCAQFNVDHSSLRVATGSDNRGTRSTAILVIASNVDLAHISVDMHTDGSPSAGVLATDLARVQVVNSIIANTSGVNPESVLPVWIDPLSDPASVNVRYTCLSNLGDFVSTGATYEVATNVYDDPMWVDPEVRDYHLVMGSPCIDAGFSGFGLDPDGTAPDLGRFATFQLGTGESDAAVLPEQFQLTRAYPNPFNATTRFTVALPAESPLRVDVYDVLGRHVATLADGVYSAGTHPFTWDARTGDAATASGIYFLRAQSAGHSQVERLVLVR